MNYPEVIIRKFVFNPFTGDFDIIDVNDNNQSITPWNIPEGQYHLIPVNKQDVFYEILVVDGEFRVDGKAYFNK